MVPLHALATLATALLPLQEGPARDGVAPERGRVVLEALDGSERAIPIADLAGRDLDELGAVLVRFHAAAPPDAEPAGAGIAAEVELASGDRLHGRLLGGEGEVLHLALVGGVVLPIGVDDLRGFVVPSAIPATTDAPIEPPAEGDRLYYRAGDALDRTPGTLHSFSDEGIAFDGAVGLVTYPWDEVAALYIEVFGDPGADGTGEGTAVVVDLSDGSRLRGTVERFGPSSLELRVGEASSVELDYARVRELVRDDGSLVFVAELPATETLAGSPFDDDLGMRWPHRADRSVTGKPLRAGGRTWTRGIGVHAPSRLAYEVPEGRWLLRGLVAIDDQVLLRAQRGSVVFRVLADGEEVWSSGVVRGGEPPLELPEIELAGGSELVLEVDMAEDLHVMDRADWLRLRLVRAGGR